MSETLREKLDRNPVCECGHTRLQHFVGGPISDCDKCACQAFEERKRLHPCGCTYDDVRKCEDCGKEATLLYNWGRLRCASCDKVFQKKVADAKKRGENLECFREGW